MEFTLYSGKKWWYPVARYIKGDPFNRHCPNFFKPQQK
jgi:hypothetical protein